MSPDRVRITYEARVADVRLTREDKHNALDWEMFASLDAAAGELATRSDIRAVVISGEGASFCSGLDFPSFAAEPSRMEEIFGHRDGDAANMAQRITYNWQRLEVPVIAALHGNCIGGGAQLALGPDIRVAGPDTRISVMEVKYGLIPDMGLTQTLPTLVGLDVAKELVFTGRFVEAEEALRIGLVTRIAGDPLAAAHELARDIAAHSPDAIRRGKSLLNESARSRSEESLALEEQLQRELLGSPNQIAAVTAAMTKQPAEFADPG
ncbi:MAG: crotonase/enoyl-CoA hydratase family protein [Solirubrobacterales bacterium]